VIESEWWLAIRAAVWYISAAMHSLLNKTLIVRLSSIGDIILASPLIRVLRKRFPDSRIDFVVKSEFAELVRYNPHLTTVIEFSSSQGFAGLVSLKRRLREVGYDSIIDIHNNFRSIYLRSFLGADVSAVIKKRQWQRLMLVRFKWNFYDGVLSVADRYIEPLSSFGIDNDGEGVEIFIPTSVLTHIKERWKTYGISTDRRVVALAHSAKHWTKMWPAEKFADLGFRIIRDGGAVVLMGGQNDRERSRGIMTKMLGQGISTSHVVDCTGDFDLLETAALMDHCSAVVANDSGLMHLASARKRPVVAIFGPTVKEFGFFPVGGSTAVVERSGLECRPCSHLGGPQCPKGHFRCMNDIEVSEVYQSVFKFLHA
jgi:lipopolysaccharide heptosyltransferase II